MQIYSQSLPKACFVANDDKLGLASDSKCDAFHYDGLSLQLKTGNRCAHRNDDGSIGLIPCDESDSRQQWYMTEESSFISMFDSRCITELDGQLVASVCDPPHMLRPNFRFRGDKFKTPFGMTLQNSYGSNVPHSRLFIRDERRHAYKQASLLFAVASAILICSVCLNEVLCIKPRKRMSMLVATK